MKKTIILASLVVVVAVGSSLAESPRRLANGFGASVTASTTPTSIQFEQAEGSDFCVNGTFASDSDWTTNGQWSIGGGSAIFTATAAITNTIYQASGLTTGKTYRVRFTVAGIDPTTNNVQILLGDNVGTLRTASGTYTEDIPFLSGDSNLTIRAKATEASALTVDDVSIRLAPVDAFAEVVQLKVGDTDVPVYVGWDCDGTTFTNIYAISRAMIVASNNAVEIDRNMCSAPIRKLWYRSASGTPTLTINAH